MVPKCLRFFLEIFRRSQKVLGVSGSICIKVLLQTYMSLFIDNRSKNVSIAGPEMRNFANPLYTGYIGKVILFFLLGNLDRAINA